MNESWITILLAILHISLYTGAIFLVRRPIISLFHLAIAKYAIAFGIRPFLSAFHDNYTIYTSNPSLSEYNFGLLIQLLFNAIFVVSYIFFIRKLDVARPVLRSYISTHSMLIPLTVGCISVLLIHILSGGSWMATERSQTLTSVVPFGKFLFPIAAIPLMVMIPTTYIWAKSKKNRSIIAIAFGCITITLLTLLYQRGFILIGIIVLFWLHERIRGLSYARVITTGTLLLIGLMIIRPLAKFIMLQGQVDFMSLMFSHGDHNAFVSFFLFGPNFDNIDVWPIILNFISDKGFLFGSTFISLISRFATPSLRQDYGLLSAVDQINAYHWGDLYWRNNFGFNVTLAQELFVNFGVASLLFAVLPAYASARLDRWLQRVSTLSLASLATVSAVFFTGGFVGELSGIIQWSVAMIIIGSLLKYINNLRVLPSATQHNNPVKAIERTD